MGEVCHPDSAVSVPILDFAGKQEDFGVDNQLFSVEFQECNIRSHGGEEN